MGDSIEILNDLDEVIKRKQQEIRERKQKQAEAKRLEDERAGKSVARDKEKSTGESVVRDEGDRSDRMKLLNDLNEIITRKEADESEAKAHKRSKRSRPTPSIRADVNRANGANSQGPITPEGKQRASANSLKHGFFANVEKLNPQDAPIYQRLVHDLRHTLHPDNPVEEMQIRELAMLSARLQRLEAAEYALLCSELDAPVPAPPATSKSDPKSKVAEPPNAEIDSRSMAAAFLNTQDAIAHLQKIEVHLRRAYNRTWDRLRIMQKERRRISPEEMRKRTHQWVSEENERTSSSSSSDPLDNSRDFDDDVPPLPSLSPSNGPQNGPPPTNTDPNPTSKEPPSA